MKSIASYQQALTYIDGFINLERGRPPAFKQVYRLDRMHFLLDLFGRPEHSFQSLHLAGSKGKGSTAVMLASVLEAAGFRVGLFTSPHLLDVRERFLVNRRPISLALFLSLFNEVKDALDRLPAHRIPGGIQPSFFEIITLIGFLAFRARRCQYVVLEVGLGGRLDATNVVTPLASLLTPLELEHEDILGDTLEKITREKCGIIKPGLPVYSSAQADAARAVIRKIARSQGAPLRFVDEEITVTAYRPSLAGSAVTLKPRSGPEFQFSLSLLGDFQAENAALVWLVLEDLFPGISRRRIAQGLKRAVLPGRMEIAGRKPLLLLDGAHTPGSAARLARCLGELLPRPRVLLFASVLGKKYSHMAEVLAPLFEWIVVSTPGNFKKSDPNEVAAAFSRMHSRVTLVAEPAAAFAKAHALAAGVHPVVVTGSFYFVAEIKKFLKARAPCLS